LNLCRRDSLLEPVRTGVLCFGHRHSATELDASGERQQREDDDHGLDSKQPLPRERRRRSLSFILHHLAEEDAGCVVNGDMKELQQKPRWRLIPLARRRVIRWPIDPIRPSFVTSMWMSSLGRARTAPGFMGVAKEDPYAAPWTVVLA
jgi:hypothetical protein